MKKLNILASVLALSIASLATPVEALKITNDLYDEDGKPFPHLNKINVIVIYSDHETGHREFAWNQDIEIGKTESHDISDFVKRHHGKHYATQISIDGPQKERNEYFPGPYQGTIWLSGVKDHDHLTIFAKKLSSGKYEITSKGGGHIMTEK